MEAVTAILSGGLHVGVLLQGKKIRDDNKTLLQSGISHDNKPDALGFTLEPNTSQSPHCLNPEDHPFLLPCDAPEPLSRYSRCSKMSVFRYHLLRLVCGFEFFNLFLIICI